MTPDTPNQSAPVPPGSPSHSPGNEVESAPVAPGWGAAQDAVPPPTAYATPATYGAPLAFKPGTIALRPQTIADFFDATFKTVRKYPGATLGFGLLVSVIAHVIPLTVVFLGDFTSSNLFDPTMSDGSGSLKFTAGDLSVVALMYTSVFISGLTSIFIGGMVANVAMSAALGEPLPLAAAWAKTRPHIWRLLGLALLTAILSFVLLALGFLVGGGIYALTDSVGWSIGVGLLIGLASSVAAVFLWIRFALLASPAIVIEGAGVMTAFKRAGTLTKGRWWRTFGTYLLLSIVIGMAVGVLGMPFSLGGGAALAAMGPDGGMTTYLALTQFGQLLTTALSGPILGLVICLLYLDARFRSEGLDVTLINHIEDQRKAMR